MDFFDPTALVAAADALLDDEATRLRMGAAARAHVVEHYDLQTVCLPKLLKWVNDLAGMQARALPE